MDDGGKVDWGFSASRDVDLLKVRIAKLEAEVERLKKIVESILKAVGRA